MTGEMMNLAIVGFGGMGNWHREMIPDVGGLRVRGTWDINPARQDAARELGLTAYGSLAEALADEAADIVLCATPNDVHKEVAVQAMRAGKHVVCEKPAAMDSGEFLEMMAVSKETGKVLAVHQNRRWDEDYRTARKIYEDRLLGEVFRIESRVHGSRGIPGDWRHEREHGGGMLLDWGVHILDQALQMIPGKVLRVYAAFDHVTNELVDDGFTADLTFENGLVYRLEVGTSNFINLPRWYLLGRDGTAVIRDFDLSGEIVRVTDWDKKDAVPIRTAAGLTKTMAPRTEETIRTDPLPIQRADIRDFYRNICGVISGTAEQIVKNEEVLRGLRLMEAITESAENHKVVSFE